jgi:hypothetical protein
VRSSRGIATARSLGLAAILLLALLLRFVGLGRELPHRIEPDSSLVFQLQRLEQDPALVRRDRLTGPYPSLPARAFALLPYPEVPARVSGPGDERAHLDAAARPYLLVRTGVALCSVAGVLLSFFLANRFLGPRVAMVVPYLVATSLLAILFAGQARPHGIQATFALAAVLLALRVRERASPGRVALAALAAAAAGASLQNGIFTLPPLALAVVLGSRKRGIAAFAAAGAACLAAGALALAFFPGLPYVDATGVHLGSTEVGAHTIHPSLSNLGGIPRVARMLWEFDPLLALLAVVGLVASVGRVEGERRLDLAVVLVYVVPYVGALVLDPNVQERFLLPLIPYIACLGARGVAWIGTRRFLVARIAAAALLAAPLVVAVCYVRTAAAPDTLTRAASWIRAHADPKECVLTTPGAVLPMLIEPAALREDLRDPSSLAHPWMVYQSLLGPPAAGDPRWRIKTIPISAWRGRRDLDFDRSRELIRDTEADLVLVENSLRMHEHFPIGECERAASAMGELVYESVGTIPGPTDGGIFEYSGSRQLARRLLTAEAFGPGIRIYRIRR